MDKTNETLQKFLEGLSAKIEDQSKGTFAIATMLTDLVDELGTLIKSLHGRAGELAKDAMQIAEEMRAAVDRQDHDAWDSSSQKVFEIKGKIEAYMECATDLQNLGEKVGRRSFETKH